MPIMRERIGSILKAPMRIFLLPLLCTATMCAQSNEIERLTAAIEAEGRLGGALQPPRGSHTSGPARSTLPSRTSTAPSSSSRESPPITGSAAYRSTTPGASRTATSSSSRTRRSIPSDVENGVWHFLCRARANGIEDARAHMLPISGDPRVPMAEIWSLFKGQASVDDVFKAANRGTGGTLHNQLFYAHLYVGLYYEALDQGAKAERAHSQGG